MGNEKFEKSMKYEIFIGLRDKDNCEEVITVEDFKNMLVEISKEMKICFSLITQFGGFTHEKGYATETSIRIVIIGADEKVIKSLSDILKERVNTDTILITKTEVEAMFV